MEDGERFTTPLRRLASSTFRSNAEAVNGSPPPLSSTSSNQLRLCSCALVRVKVKGRNYVVLTQRQARNTNDSTFSGMWVFPGGHVDMVGGKLEGLEKAAIREVKEETGLSVDGCEAICTYQAALVNKKRGYLICFYKCEGGGEFGTAEEALKGVCKKECRAAALIPEVLFKEGIFSPEICTGMESKQAKEKAREGGMGVFEGVRVVGDEVVGAEFQVEEIVGDGGEGPRGGGIGMAHRWASECFRRSVE